MHLWESLKQKNNNNNMDIWSAKKRSEVMSKILSCNTGPEQRVRRILSDMGYRYRLHVKELPGKPDIVLRKYGVVILVNGCFWHLHNGCIDGRIPKIRTRYWKNKLFKNKKRDMKNIKMLKRMGWKVVRIWECEVEKSPELAMEKIYNVLHL
jgi:DNA mismatch endonuclease (patch repair protein)